MGIPIPRWSQCALKRTASEARAGSLPGMMAATLLVWMSRTLLRMLPRMRNPKGIGLKSRESASLRSSGTVLPPIASSFDPASSVTQPAKASSGCPGPSRT